MLRHHWRSSDAPQRRGRVHVVHRRAALHVEGDGGERDDAIAGTRRRRLRIAHRHALPPPRGARRAVAALLAPPFNAIVNA